MDNQTFGRSRKLPDATKYGWTKPDENGWIASANDSGVIDFFSHAAFVEEGRFERQKAIRTTVEILCILDLDTVAM